MSGMPPSHFDDFLSEFAHLRVGVMEKPFSLETLRKKLLHVQGVRHRRMPDRGKEHARNLDVDAEPRAAGDFIANVEPLYGLADQGEEIGRLKGDIGRDG